MKKLSVKTFVAIGIGSALFFVLGKFVAIPVFSNTTISLQYGVLGLFAILYGPVAGFLIGLIGHLLIDLTTYGAWWSWIISSAVVGLIIGMFSNKFDIENGEFNTKEIVLFNVIQIATNLISWGIVAPVLDILIYSEPANKVFIQGLIAGASNSVTTAVIATLLLIGYSKTRVKKGSLNKE